jgi:D-alanyl-D-alanine carboxypeptidase
MNIEQTLSDLQRIVNRAVDNKLVFGVSVCVEKGDGSFSFSGAAGNLETGSQYFIASTTKLYTSATTLKLASQKLIRLDDPAINYLDQGLMEGLLVIKGVDYSSQITIRQLLAHTSGLPDYFQQKKASGRSLLNELTSGLDQHWTFEEVITETKKMKPAFHPGAKGKALYSDTNYQLLGRIVEAVTGKPITALWEEFVFAPLGLSKTYLYQDSQDTRPASLYYKSNPLHMPLAMTSFDTDGGIVSTSAELMTFLKAFFNGQFFPVETFAQMKQWNRIFFPLEAGVGLTRFKLPRLFSPFKAMPEFIGHSGLSGTVAFYAPEKDIYLTGTVNQVDNPGRSFRLMIELLNCL